jgi:hypothetical protein
VLGSDADTTQTIKDTFTFAKEMNLDSAQFFALTAVPGPPMTARYEKEGKLIAPGQWHLYDAQHAVVQPKKMTAYELQMGTIEASLNFYSYREAFRHLLNGRGLFNALIRIKGRQLAKRILADNAEYIRSLRQLDDWQMGFQRECESWREWASKLIEDTNLGLDEKLERIRRFFNEKATEVSASYEALRSDFRPFCQSVADRMIDKLRHQLEVTLDSTLKNGTSLPVFQA